MKSKIFILLALIVFLVGCATQPAQIVCNKPYILVGNDCCLDKDDNSICDSDEQQKAETPKPEIETKEVEEKPTYTIGDVQADMGNVILETIVLTKDQELDYAQVYSNKLYTTKFLGKYDQTPFFKILTKKPQKVIQITEPEYYLENNEDFQNFVTENKDIFIESALNSKEIFENEFKEGELLKNMWLKREYSNSKSMAEKAKYVDHSESSVLFYDDLTFPETISGNLAEINYIRVNKYEVNISSEYNKNTLKYTSKASNINYGQSLVIHCSPNLVISLSFEDYGDGSSAKYEKTYDSSDYTRSSFLTALRDHEGPLITDAQALIKMCEQRYEFTYGRLR